jgi:hypothetical protein
MLRNFVVYFQRLSIVAGGSTRHTRDMADGKNPTSGTFSLNYQPVGGDAELAKILEEARPVHEQHKLTPEAQAEQQRLVSRARKKADAIAAEQRAKRRAQMHGQIDDYIKEHWTEQSPAARKRYNALGGARAGADRRAEDQSLCGAA